MTIGISTPAKSAVPDADLIYEIAAPIAIILALCALRLALEK